MCFSTLDVTKYTRINQKLIFITLSICTGSTQPSKLNLENVVTLDCKPDGWNISVDLSSLRAAFPKFAPEALSLSDFNCSGTVVGDLLTLRVSYDDCWTQRKVDDNDILYSNYLVYIDANQDTGIARGYKWKVDIQCKIPRHEALEAHYNPHLATAKPSITAVLTGNLAHINFFNDSNYQQRLSGSPLFLGLGKTIYVQVLAGNVDRDVKMVVNTCYAKPDVMINSNITYNLIKDGCEADPDTYIIGSSYSETRFSFSTFVFTNHHDVVHVICDVMLCQDGDFSQKC